MPAIKYRIKLRSGRIVGPFFAEQIAELYLKKHINGTENAQVFPGGVWAKCESIPELLEQISIALISGEKKPPEKINEEHSLSSVKVPEIEVSEEKSLKEESEIDNFLEFKFAVDEAPIEIPVDYDQLEKNFQKNVDQGKSKNQNESKNSIDKTRVIKSGHKKNPLNKTVVNVDMKSFKDNQDFAEEIKQDEVQNELKDNENQNIEPRASDKTQAVSLKDMIHELRQKTHDGEIEIEKKIIEDNKEKTSIATLISPPTPKAVEKKEPQKKAMKPIVLLAFIAIFIVIFFPDENQKFGDQKPQYSVISFPIPDKYEDSNKAANDLKEGVKLYNKGTYLDRLKSSEKFKQSLEAKFQDNPQALGWLVLNDAELLPNSLEQEKGITNLFRLIQLARGRVITDINVAMGTALFYGQIKKTTTALTTIENYLRVQSKPSSKLYGIYLDLLIKGGRWVDAGKVYEQLSAVKDPPADSYLPMSRFLSQAGKSDEAKAMLEKGLQRFPQSISLFLEYCSYLLGDQNFKTFEKALTNIKKVNSENAPNHMARFLEYLGMLDIVKKKPESAVVNFKKALAIYESDELRSKLSSLEIGGSQRVESLIRESKIIDMIGKSKIAENERRWDEAYKLAIDAADLSENYIPSQLWLASIQTKRGYFNSAIETLEKLQKDNPLNGNINYSLIATYIQARKFDLVQHMLGQISGTKLGRTSEFAYQMGAYYRKINNTGLAIKWFNDSIAINPVNDQAYFDLAEIYFEGRKYDRSKIYASKALELDPENSIYHGMIARILYETENVDVAIGYLRDVLETKQDDPYLMSEIAIHYKRSDRIKEFETHQAKIHDLTNPTQNFYDFMIYISKLNDNTDNVIKYCNELLKINPGVMEIRLILGESYLKKGNYKDALTAFDSVKQRLISYPRVNYWIAKTYLQLKDYEKAKNASMDEIKYNPVLEFGHFALGETYRQQQKYPEALLSFEKALSLNGRSIEILSALAWIKHRQNYPNIARDFYEKILKIEPGNPETHKQMGLVYKDLGQGSLAIEQLKIYLDLDPGAPDRGQIESLIRQLQ